MSRLEKVKAKLRNRSSSITYSEVKFLLSQLGYLETQKGKTSGSRVAFHHPKTLHIILLHKPHPGNELKEYAKKQLLITLKDNNLL